MAAHAKISFLSRRDPPRRQKRARGVLLFAAQICARYSDGGSGKIPVDYCKIKYVKKPPKAKPGFVIYTDHKTILVEN